MKKTMKKTIVFQAVRNCHVDEPGKKVLSELSKDHSTRGYFENEHGEQWVLWHDDGSPKTFFTGGDIGWDLHEIDMDAYYSSPSPEAFAREDIPVVLNAPEWSWLKACLAALRPHYEFKSKSKKDSK